MLRLRPDPPAARLSKDNFFYIKLLSAQICFVSAAFTERVKTAQCLRGGKKKEKDRFR